MGRATLRAADASAPLDIDELARRAGTTVRTVRMYQERGLLPPPERVGRRAAYGEEHLIRLRLVQRLAGRGYSLAAIKDLVHAWDAQHGLAHVLGLEGAVVEPSQVEPPRRYGADELAAMFGGGDEPVGLARAIRLGLLVVDGDDLVAPVPTLVDAGARLVAAGMPVDAVLDVAEATLAAADALAARFVDAFLDHVWAPFESAGEPDTQVAVMAAEIRDQRALAVRAVAASLAAAVDAHVDRAIMSRLGR